MNNQYNRKNRRKYMLKVHIVLVTKYRKRLLNRQIAEDVKQKIFDISKLYGFSVIAMETDQDHIHILLDYDTTISVSKIVKIIKQHTTQHLWIRYTTYLHKHFWKKRIFCLMDTLFVA